LDEPFSSLDARMRADLRDGTVDILKAEGLAALFVTHDADEAMAAGDRLALLREGRIIQTGGSAELYDAPVDPEAGRLFGPLNLVPGRVRSGEAQSPLGAVAAENRSEGERVWLAFRPDGAHIGLESVADSALGVVEKVQPSGADMALKVRLAEWPDTALELRNPRDPRVSAGREVWIRLVADRTIVFGGDADGAPSSEGF
jgi:iron(III) transport system ATP-binding protein